MTQSVIIMLDVSSAFPCDERDRARSEGKSMRGVHVRLGLVFLLLTKIGAGAASTAEHDEEAARIAVNRFAEAWNRHDMDAFGTLFARNADFVNVSGQLWKGRKEIQRRHAYTHGAIPREAVP